MVAHTIQAVPSHNGQSRHEWRFSSGACDTRAGAAYCRQSNWTKGDYPATAKDLNSKRANQSETRGLGASSHFNLTTYQGYVFTVVRWFYKSQTSLLTVQCNSWSPRAPAVRMGIRKCSVKGALKHAC